MVVLQAIESGNHECILFLARNVPNTDEPDYQGRSVRRVMH
jgi:hypothetical protein